MHQDVVTSLIKAYIGHADVLEVGNDVTVSPSGVSAKSLLIKKITVSGK